MIRCSGWRRRTILRAGSGREERNARWAEWIGKRMARPGTVFLAVGAGHLGGPQSVQDKLAALGLKARRVDR